MSQVDSATTNSLSVGVLWRALLGLNAAFLAIALVSSLAFRSLAGFELLLWFIACEALLFLVIFVPVFLFYLVWGRQKPSTAAAQSLDALVSGITLLVP